jgi:hypothetical protein
VNARPRALVLAATASILAACTNTISMSGANAAIPQVRVHAEDELDCPQADIRIEEQPGGRFLAVGCGKKAVYQAQCVGLNCRVRGPNDPPISFRDFPDPGSPLLQR